MAEEYTHSGNRIYGGKSSERLEDRPVYAYSASDDAGKAIVEKLNQATINLSKVSSINFDTIDDAIVFAKDHGGWICKGENTVQWFDAAKWTQTKIINATSGNREIGTWPMMIFVCVHFAASNLPGM